MLFLVDYYYLFVIIIVLIFIFSTDLRQIYTNNLIHQPSSRDYYYSCNLIYSIFSLYKIVLFYILIYFTFGFISTGVSVDLFGLLNNIFLLTKFLFFLFLFLFLFLFEFYIKLVN